MALIEINQNFGESSEYLFLFVLTILVAWILLVIFSYRTYGYKKTIRFFLPMILASLFVESAGVAYGRYYYPNYLLYISLVGGSVPIIIAIGWSVNLFLFIHMGQFFVEKFYKTTNLLQVILISIVGGGLGICLDLITDPIAHHNNWWIWNQSTSGISFYDVPLTNFRGWFIFILYMSVLTLLIDRSRYSENRKLLISLFSISIVGAAILVTQFFFMGSV